MEHKQNAHNDGNRTQPLKRLFETVSRHKYVHRLHHRCYIVEHKVFSVTSEPTQRSFVLKGLIRVTNN